MQDPKKKKEEEKKKSYCFTVSEPSKLMKFLLDQMSEKSRNTIKSYLVHRLVSVDNQITSQYDHPLIPGQIVLVKQPGKVEETVKYRGLKILYEDPNIIIIDKEPGLLSIATAKERRQTAYFILTEHVRKTNRNNRIYIVHRLDKEASGIMMFARSVEMQEILQRDWQKAVVDRRYAALVEGSVEKHEDTIISWLIESKALIMYSYKFDNGGQKAISHYKVINRNDLYSLLEVTLDTGRKNQIRVHMQSIGHSIVGDKKYGSSQNPIKRMGLHAISLAFKHPVTGEEMRFESQIPKSFFSLLNR